MIPLQPIGAGGLNRTGIATWPERASSLQAAASDGHPSSRGDESALAAMRVIDSKEARPFGAAPRLIAKGAAPGAVAGRNTAMFIDKLGERLAFERLSARMVEALIAKLRAGGSWSGGPTIRELTRMRDDELRHFEWVRRALCRLGADPTAMSPSSDLVGVEMAGVVEVLTDPRVTPAQGLHAILIAELVDNDGWAWLCELASAIGHAEVAREMGAALAEEQRHLSLVRSWIRSYVMRDGTLELDTRIE